MCGSAMSTLAFPRRPRTTAIHRLYGRLPLGKRVYREVPWVRIPLSPPFSLQLQRLLARLPQSQRNPSDSAASWPPGSCASEPETAGSGRGRRRGPCSSLLAIWSVRFRSRFADRLVRGPAGSRHSSQDPDPCNLQNPDAVRRSGLSLGERPRPISASEAAGSARLAHAGQPLVAFVGSDRELIVGHRDNARGLPCAEAPEQEVAQLLDQVPDLDGVHHAGRRES